MSFLGRLATAASAAGDRFLGRTRAATSTPTPTTASTRPACIYGARCYRKNPQHKADEWHPGDPEDPVVQAAAAAAAEAEAAAVKPPPAPVAASRIDSRPAATADLSVGAASNSGRATPSSSVVSPSVTSPLPCDSPASATSGSVASTDSSPRFDKKLSAKQRRQRQKEAEAAAAASPTSVASSPSPLGAATGESEAAESTNAAASVALPAQTPTLTPSFSTTSAPLLASLHALYKSPLVPEFSEIRGSAASASAGADSGTFYVGRSREGVVDGRTVRVDLVLATNTPRLAKMISRVHARIQWTRTPLAGGAPIGGGLFSYHWTIQDLDSVNGIFVNHVKVRSGVAHALGPEDRIVFGGGAGVAPGTFVRVAPEEAEFMFRFNCIERTPGAEPTMPPSMMTAAAVAAPVDKVAKEASKEETDTRRPAKRSLSSATATAPRPLLKRLKSEDMATDIAEEEEEKMEENSAVTSKAEESDSDSDRHRREDDEEDGGATQNFDDLLGGGGSDAEDTECATQDYHDAERDHARTVAGECATQDFGDAGHEAEEDGMATQDGGDMLE